MARTIAPLLLPAIALLAGCGDGGGGGMSHSMSTSSSSSETVTPTPCSPASMPGGPYCLQWVGRFYDVHIGQQFKVALVDATDGTTVIAGTTVSAIPSGAFAVSLPNAMVANHAYYVDYYADENKNHTCDPPATDHVWRSHTVTDFTHGTIATVTATTGDVVWSADHDDPFLTDPTGMNTCPQLNSFTGTVP